MDGVVRLSNSLFIRVIGRDSGSADLGWAEETPVDPEMQKADPVQVDGSVRRVSAGTFSVIANSVLVF